MDVIVDYASSMINISGAILDHKRGLSREQTEYVEIIHRRAMDFVQTYMDKYSGPVQELRHYLSHDAVAPVATIIGFADLLLMDAPHDLAPPYAEAIREMHEYAEALLEEIDDLLQQVWDFMQEMGIPK